MPVEIPVGFGQVIMPYFNNDSTEENIVTFGVDLDLWGVNWVGAIDSITAAFRAAWQASTDDGIQLLPGRMQVGNAGPPIVVVSTLNSVTGVRSGAAVSPQVATIVTKRTAFGGRAFRGRCYFPGLLQATEADQGGRVQVARRTALAAIADSWFTYMVTGVGFPGATLAHPLVLLHSPPAAGGTTPAPTSISSLEVQPVVGTQRGRLPR